MTAESVVHPDRIRALRQGPPAPGPVICWLRRDQRAHDNWALLHAQDLALHLGQPLLALVIMEPGALGATHRHDAFQLAGLQETAGQLAAHGIPLAVTMGEAVTAVSDLAQVLQAGAVVADLAPLRHDRQAESLVAERLTVPLHLVDAHNVVPAWRVSDKQEYAARTIRPRIQRQLPEFLTEFPVLRPHPHAWPGRLSAPDWAGMLAASDDHAGPPLTWCEPGPTAATAAMERFIERGLAAYDTARNDPTVAGQSELSPYLRYGQLAPQRVALAASRSEATGREAFLEELVVRRELSDNFCLHNPRYDDVEGFPAWARQTLEEHADDPREHLYEVDRFEEGTTHDPLWNAAQTELVVRGKMHGYLRMYWAKKILEWTRDPGEALDVAVGLNDRYSLDGRCPNGYVGCAWSIGGLHDQAWRERPVFGKVRYMNQNGCRRKFRVDRYIDAMARRRRESS